MTRYSYLRFVCVIVMYLAFVYLRIRADDPSGRAV